MIANVRARYANGVLTPLEPLDLEEGAEVVVSVGEAQSPKQGLAAIAELVKELHKSIPADAWDNLPSDGAKNYKHYLYGHPKAEDR